MKESDLLYKRLKKLTVVWLLLTCWNVGLINQQVIIENKKVSPVKDPLVTQRFSTSHKGYDIIDKFDNRKVYSIVRCRIVDKGFTGNRSPYLTCYDFNNQMYYKYIHITSDLIINQILDSGDIIGNYNNEGNSLGYHLHLEIYDGKNNYNKESVDKWKM